jgi:hypothetical protein
LLVGAFLPFHLYLSQYVTNEPLAGLFMTTAFYCFLRGLEADRFSWWLGVGIALGAAALTKASSWLGVFLFPAALGLRLFSRRQFGLRDWLRSVGIILLVCLFVGGWHFARVWSHPSQPIMGIRERASAFAWWQDPGFRTEAFYSRAGQALVSPLFSGLHSFADGIYSTLWGDGLASGAACLTFRPPWNYNPMGAGYWLALGLCALFATGLAVTLVRFICGPEARWFVALGLVFVFTVGIVYFSLRLPSPASVKAFYAFPVLAPISALIVVGWNWWAQQHRVLQSVLWTVLLLWLMTVYAAFWIRRGNPETCLVRGIYLADHNRYAEAADSLFLALQVNESARQSGQITLPDQSLAQAHSTLATILYCQGRTTEAIEHFHQALRAREDFAEALGNLAWILSTCANDHLRSGRRGVELAERACRATDYREAVYIGILAAAYAEVGRIADAVAMAEKARDKAQAEGAPTIAKKQQELLRFYRAGKPYHELSRPSR